MHLYFFKYCWPREMRGAVEELSSAGNLNEVAVKTINHKIVEGIFLFFLIGVGVSWYGFLQGMSAYLLAAIVGCSLVVLVATYVIIIHKMYYYCMRAYCHGQLCEAEVLKFKKHVFYGAISYEIEYVLAKNAQSGKVFFFGNPGLFPKDFPEEGEVINVFHNLKNSYRSMLDIPYLKEVYSLKKNII